MAARGAARGSISVLIGAASQRCEVWYLPHRSGCCACCSRSLAAAQAPDHHFQRHCNCCNAAAATASTVTRIPSESGRESAIHMRVPRATRAGCLCGFAAPLALLATVGRLASGGGSPAVTVSRHMHMVRPCPDTPTMQAACGNAQKAGVGDCLVCLLQKFPSCHNSTDEDAYCLTANKIKPNATLA